MFKAIKASYKESLHKAQSPKSRKVIYAALLVSGLIFGVWDGLSPPLLSTFIVFGFGYSAAAIPSSLMNKHRSKINMLSIFIFCVAMIFTLRHVYELYPGFLGVSTQNFIEQSIGWIFALYLISRALFLYHLMMHHMNYKRSLSGAVVSVVLKVVILVSLLLIAPILFLFVLPLFLVTLFHAISTTNREEFGFGFFSESNRWKSVDGFDDIHNKNPHDGGNISGIPSGGRVYHQYGDL